MIIDGQGLASQNGKFIDPIMTMSDVKGDIVYADRGSPFFLIVEGSRFYIGHPIGEGGMAGDDRPYTGGDLTDCSTVAISCRAAGAHVFIRAKSGRQPASYFDGTAVTAWANARGWWGAGAWYPVPTAGHDAGAAANRPLVTYQYEVSDGGEVTRILVAYWQAGSDEPLTYALKLETRRGIQL